MALQPNSLLPSTMRRYQATSISVAVSSCGLIVIPLFSWLGASHGRTIFDPVKGSYGMLEIKCPHTLHNHNASQLATVNFCCEIDGEKPKLKRDHPYYYQLLGQIGVSGLMWGDYVVYGFDFILIERVKFDQNEWDSKKKHLGRLLFWLFPAISEEHEGRSRQLNQLLQHTA